MTSIRDLIYSREEYYISSSAILLLFLSSMAPLISFYGALILLVLSGGVSDFTRRLLGFVVIFSGSVIYSSREVFLTSSDDFSAYYDTYLKAVSGDWESVIETFSDGFEIFSSLLFIAISIVFGQLSPHHLLFILIFLVSIVFFVWLEIYGLKSVDDDLKAICMASTLLLLSFGFFGQVVRQSQASIFILFALSQGGMLRRYIFLGLATACHLTSPIIYLIFKTFMFSSRKIKMLTLGVFVVFSLFFQYYLEQLISSNWTGLFSVFNKTNYYKEMTVGFTDVDMANVKLISIGFVAAIFFFDKEIKNKKWNSLLFYGGGCYLMLLPYPLAPTRVMLIYSVLLMGYLLFFSFRRNLMLYQSFLIAYILYGFMNKVQTLNSSGGGFDLWYSFSWFDFQPFYYFIY